MASSTPTIGEMLRIVGCPLVEVAADEDVRSIARLMSFSGLGAVLLVRPCGGAERIVAGRDVLCALAGRESPCRHACGIPRCAPEDGFHAVARAMLDEDHPAVLVERRGERLALITRDSLADYLAAGA